MPACTELTQIYRNDRFMRNRVGHLGSGVRPVHLDWPIEAENVVV